MEELLNNIKSLCGNFIAEAEKNVSGNKTAGVRARKTSLELEKVLKEFRKASLASK